MQFEKIIRSFDGVELYHCQDIPESNKATVVVVHGLGEQCRRYDYVVRKLNAAGYGVIRFDNRGHGRSGGARGYLRDFNAFLDDTDFIVERTRLEHEEKPIFLLGHSMGGFITAAYGVKYPGKLAGQVLSGACAKSLPIFESFRRANIDKIALNPSPNSLSALICRSQAVVDAYDRDPYVLQVFTNKLLHEVFINGIDWFMASVSHHAVPCLILHGGEDRIVPVESSQYLYDHTSAQDKTITIYPGLYHEILNEEKEKDGIIADIVAWLDKRVQ